MTLEQNIEKLIANGYEITIRPSVDSSLVNSKGRIMIFKRLTTKTHECMGLIDVLEFNTFENCFETLVKDLPE